MPDPTPATHPSSGESFTGRVISVHGRSVLIEREGDNALLEASIPGRMKKEKRRSLSPVSAGDRASGTLVDSQPDATTGRIPARIDEIGERHGILSRPSTHNQRLEQVVAVNVDQVLCVAGADLVGLFAQPDHLEVLDSLLVAAASAALEAVIVINKCDLNDDQSWLDDVLAPYVQLGNRLVWTSAATGQGIEELRELMQGRISVYSGPSGVGKSSLVNAIAPGMHLRTGEVSDKSGEGRHTTTHVSLLRLPFGGYVVDTPGIREFGLWNVKDDELQLWYPDYVALQSQCRFAPCTHTHEPGCAVKAGLEDGSIDVGRYERYRRLRNQLRELNQNQQR